MLKNHDTGQIYPLIYFQHWKVGGWRSLSNTILRIKSPHHFVNNFSSIISWHTTLFNCSSNVLWTLWTLDGRWNNVVSTISFSDMDLCQPNPCKNSGQCFGFNGGYQCDCQKGYRGKNCDRKFVSFSQTISIFL